MYDLVLFDLDGTLINTAPDIADAVNRVLEGRSLPTVSERWVRNRIGHGTRLLLAQAIAAAPRMNPARMTPELMAELLDEFSTHYAQCCGRRGRLYPEAASVLGTLRTIGVKLALVTNKEKRFVRFLLEVHGVDGDFDVEVCGDSLPAKKPDPLPVQHCLRLFGIQPQSALFVGDSAVDVETARKAGVPVWAVAYGYNHGHPIGRSKPDRVIATIAEVLEPFADRIHAVGGGRHSPRASSINLYLRNNPRN